MCIYDNHYYWFSGGSFAPPEPRQPPHPSVRPWGGEGFASSP